MEKHNENAFFFVFLYADLIFQTPEWTEGAGALPRAPFSPPTRPPAPPGGALPLPPVVGRVDEYFLQCSSLNRWFDLERIRLDPELLKPIQSCFFVNFNL